jgi:hypothetical protein
VLNANMVSATELRFTLKLSKMSNRTVVFQPEIMILLWQIKTKIPPTQVMQHSTKRTPSHAEVLSLACNFAWKSSKRVAARG